MPTATLTSKGQITLPRRVREHLRVQTGDAVDFIIGSDVGGGYDDRRLSDITLAWMMGKTTDCGLALEPSRRPAIADGHARGALHDSYGNFLFGLYGVLKGRYLRELNLGTEHRQTLDESVGARRRDDRSYDPRNPGLPAA